MLALRLSALRTVQSEQRKLSNVRNPCDDLTQRESSKIVNQGPPAFAKRRLPRRSPQGEGGQVAAAAQKRATRAEARRAKAGDASKYQASFNEAAMTYVYILQSIPSPEKYYVGVTQDLRSRLQKHNAGDVSHTSKFLPWEIKTYIAFTDEKQASAFEKYLKSASGRAFAKKRL